MEFSRDYSFRHFARRMVRHYDLICYDMEVGENRVRVFYDTEKREGERLEIYTEGISPCSSDRVLDL